MPSTFDNFSDKASFNPDDKIVGFDSTALGGEKKWTYRTLMNSISSQLYNSGVFFPVSGGTVTGNSTFNNDVTVIGTLSANGLYSKGKSIKPLSGIGGISVNDNFTNVTVISADRVVISSLLAAYIGNTIFT